MTDLRMGTAQLGDEEFVEAFESCRLPGEQFHHEDHLRLAWIYLRQHGMREAEARLLRGIPRFAEHHGSLGKFHYTMTVAWLRIVAAARAAQLAEMPFVELLAACPELCDRQLLAKHYSQELLQSEAARTSWVPPRSAPDPVRQALRGIGQPRSAFMARG